MYAEFVDVNTSSLIQQYARNLQHGRRLSIYVPSSLQLRFSQVNSLAHQIRNGPVKCKTRVKYGASDFVLLQKPKEGNSPWTYASLESLPPLQLTPLHSVPYSSQEVRKSSKRTHSGDSNEVRENRPRLSTQIPEIEVQVTAGQETELSLPVTNPKEPVNEQPMQGIGNPTSTLSSPPELSAQDCTIPVGKGLFLPSACASPSGITNKNFNFTSKSSIPKPLNF